MGSSNENTKPTDTAADKTASPSTSTSGQGQRDEATGSQNQSQTQTQTQIQTRTGRLAGILRRLNERPVYCDRHASYYWDTLASENDRRRGAIVTCFVLPTPWLAVAYPNANQPRATRWKERARDMYDYYRYTDKEMYDKDTVTLPVQRAGLVVQSMVVGVKPVLSPTPSPPPPYRRLHLAYTARVRVCKHAKRREFMPAWYWQIVVDRLPSGHNRKHPKSDGWNEYLGAADSHPQSARNPERHKDMSITQIASPLFGRLAPYVAGNVARAFALAAAGKACRQTWPWRAMAREDQQRANDYCAMVRRQVGNAADTCVRAKVKQQIQEKLDELQRQDQLPTLDTTISLGSVLTAVCDHPDHRVDPRMGHKRKQAEFVHGSHGNHGGQDDSDDDSEWEDDDDYDGVRVVTVDTAATTDVPWLPADNNSMSAGPDPRTVNPNKPRITLTDTTIDGGDYKELTWSYTVHLPLEGA